MNPKATSYLPALAAILIVVGIVPEIFSQDPSASLRPAELAQIWLENNCAVGEESPLTVRLKQIAKEVEPILIRAWKEGPPAGRVAEVRKDAERQFAVLQKAIRSGETFGLTPEDLELAREQRSEKFTEEAVGNYVVRYRSQALVGMGITAGPEAGKVLETATTDEDPTLSHVARLVARSAK